MLSIEFYEIIYNIFVPPLGSNAVKETRNVDIFCIELRQRKSHFWIDKKFNVATEKLSNWYN